MVKKNWSTIYDLRQIGELTDELGTEINDSGKLADITSRLCDCKGHFVKVSIKIIERE